MCYHCGTVLADFITREGREASALPGTLVQCMTCERWSVMGEDGLLRSIATPKWPA